MRLKQSAGWNQTEQDWANVLALEPEGCWVYEAEGQVAGSTTAVCYGQDLAWIGMVLVSPEFRGRGYGRALMEHALQFLERRRVRVVRLDATDMGRPLYEKLGFREECAIERWAAAAVATDAGSQHPLRAACLEERCRRRRVRPAGIWRGPFRKFSNAWLRACFPATAASPGWVTRWRGRARPRSFWGPAWRQDAATARVLIETAAGPPRGRGLLLGLAAGEREAHRMAVGVRLRTAAPPDAHGVRRRRILRRRRAGTRPCSSRRPDSNTANTNTAARSRESHGAISRRV